MTTRTRTQLRLHFGKIHCIYCELYCQCVYSCSGFWSRFDSIQNVNSLNRSLYVYVPMHLCIVQNRLLHLVLKYAIQNVKAWAVSLSVWTENLPQRRRKSSALLFICSEIGSDLLMQLMFGLGRVERP